MQEQTSYEEQVLSWLRSKSGDVVLIGALTKKYGVGQAAMLTMLNELVIAGKVRRSTAKRTLGFYIPSEGMLQAERNVSSSILDRGVLKVDKARRELYAQLQAARDAIPSIG